MAIHEVGGGTALQRVTGASVLLVLLAATPSRSDERHHDLDQLAFLAGDWHLHPSAAPITEAALVRVAGSAGIERSSGSGFEPVSASDVTGLDTLVLAILAADYRGDRAELRRLAFALNVATDPRLTAYRLYWRGFAGWRRALNGFNETPAPSDLRSDLEEAVQSFRAALVEKPGWIEAKIGIVGCLGNLLFLSGDDPARTGELRPEYVPALRDMAESGGGNPRALWLIGSSELGAPPPYGGHATKAAATFRRGLEAARREARDGAPRPAHVPSWGGAENLMSLAYLYSHSALEDRALALAYAEATLTLVPHWHYVADVLVPQIEALDSPGPAREKSIASVALRVHRLQAMVAFYSEAFGVRFREVDASGIRSQFGTIGGLELRLVPIREEVEFERFPIHQLGFEVPDVLAVISAAERHGGRLQDAPSSAGGRVYASVRDPDGNTVEIHGPR